MGKNKMRSIYEKEEIIQDYLRSGQKVGTYARLHDIPRTSLVQWLAKLPVLQEGEKPTKDFYDITTEVKTSSPLIQSKGIERRSEPQVFEAPISNRNVKMTLPNGTTLECDVDILTMVIGAIKL